MFYTLKCHLNSLAKRQLLLRLEALVAPQHVGVRKGPEERRLGLRLADGLAPMAGHRLQGHFLAALQAQVDRTSCHEPTSFSYYGTRRSC